MSIFDTVSTRQSLEQIVLEVVRIKLSSSLSVSRSDRTLIIGCIEAHYGRAKKYRTKENKLYGGTVFGIPYNENLAGLTLLVSILDKNHDLTVDIAESTLCLAEDSSNQLTTLGSTPKECSANLTRNKGRERVGKLIYRISRISIFSEGVSEKNFSKKKNPEKEELNVLCNLPDFQFRRLVKPIHWERLKSLNLDRIVHGVDVTTLMSFADDVALGDVSQEDVDHKLQKTLQLNQYSVQYLRSCQKAMTHNKAAINEALKVFDDEEAILDLKLARMRTRSKALKREDASLDTLHSEYSDLLLALDPVLMKAYKKSLDSDSQSKKKRFLNDFTSGVDVNEGARATSERGHSRPGAGSGRGRGAEELSEDSNAWKGAGLTSSSKLDGVSPSPSPSQSSSWAELASNKRDEKSKSLGATEGENYWAKQGSWESGQKYQPVQRPPLVQPLKDEDSGSDSGSGSDFRRKNAVRRGSVDKDEMVRLTSPVLSGPKASVTDPDTDRSSDKRGRRDQENERMSALFDKPRVTFDSFSRNSKSDFSREFQASGTGTGTGTGTGAGPDQDNVKAKSGEVRQSAAWSTMGSQNSMMSADSLAAPAKGVKHPSEAAHTALPMPGKAIGTKAEKNFDAPKQSISPDPGSGPWTRRDDVEDDVEVIDLDDAAKGAAKSRHESPVLRSVKVDNDDSSVNSSVVSIPSFAPVAAAISNKWSENDIGEEIARNKLYDSDSSHGSRSPNPQRALKSTPKPQMGFSPGSESDSDFSPLPVRAFSKTVEFKADKSPDPWVANKESSKFSTFLNSNSRGIAMPSAAETEITSDSLEKPPTASPAVEVTKPTVGDSPPTAARSTAYTDFIQGTSETEKKKATESSQQMKSSSGSIASSVKGREGSKDSVAGVSHGLQRKQEHEDLFERPSRMSLSSTFPGPGGLSAKQQMEQGRLSKTSSLFNSEEEDDDDFFDDDEGDVIDTSTSVVLDFFSMENHGSSPDNNLGIAQIPISTTVTSDRLGPTRAVKEGSGGLKSAEVFTDLTLSQASVFQEGDVEDWDPKVHDPYDSKWETNKWKGKPPDAVKALQFTIRDSEDRGSGNVETREINRPDSVEEEDDDVLYGTTRFGGTRTINDEYDGTLKNTGKGIISKSKNFQSSSPFGTLLSSNAHQKPDGTEADNNNSVASSDINIDEGPNHHENLDSSFHPSDSANSLNFNLSQSTVIFDIEKINNFVENKEKKRESDEEKVGDSKQKKSMGVKEPVPDEINSGLKWRTGKASVELIETGRAFEVYVGALKLHDESLLSVCLQLEFLGLRSASSPMIPQSAITTVQPVNFSSYISSAPEIITLLTDEIQAEGEYLSFRINLIDMDEDSADIDRGAEGKENVLAQGSVALWVMIEDSCSILRQEVDILDCVNNKIIGFAVVDVRGHRFLKECS